MFATKPMAQEVVAWEMGDWSRRGTTAPIARFFASWAIGVAGATRGGHSGISTLINSYDYK
jgi:hypothetical protein